MHGPENYRILLSNSLSEQANPELTSKVEADCDEIAPRPVVPDISVLF